MIITRTPFRISFAGGGSDISSFYSKHDGCVLSTAINKYMYISVHPSFNRQNTVLKYSKTETVNNLSDIEHQYFKQVLSNLGITGVELVSTADIPSGTGLGSSSSFTKNDWRLKRVTWRSNNWGILSENKISTRPHMAV